VTAYELDFFGRVSSLKEAALSQYLATEEGRKTAQISLIAAVANGYLSILADDELLDITRQTLATREESMKLSKLRFDNGVVSELDYRQAESLLEAARVAYAQQLRQRALDVNALILLVGQPLADELPMASVGGQAAALAQAQPMADVPAGLPSELLTNRPDIRQAEQLLLASNANIGAARAAFFPKISLTVGAGSASSHLSGLLKNGSWGWTLAPQLVLPIFDAGRNQAGLDSAKAGRDIAIAQYEKAIQTAFREVADALATRATLVDQLRASQAQANAEAARFKLSDLRYQSGIASYLDLLDAQRSLFSAQQAVVQTRLAQLQSQVTLYKTLGGGWKEPVAPTAAP
jgi:multidrug efflux system outer membrane protein